MKVTEKWLCENIIQQKKTLIKAFWTSEKDYFFELSNFFIFLL